MNKGKNKTKLCILPSELTPEQIASLPFVPEVLNNFDEKEKLPPTARAQWTYIQLNPNEYLDRFKAELGLIGINAAICFINKEAYSDKERELQTPISVNLIVSEGQFEDAKSHLDEKKLSHKLMEDGKGFVLPYLGSIQKVLDTLSLQNLIHYVFVKNSISREAYSTWISVPQSYLEQKPKKKNGPEPKQVSDEEADIKEQVAKALMEENVKEEKSETSTNTPQNSDSSEKEKSKENFNYVIYDDTGETTPPLPVEKTDPAPKSVVVTTEKAPKKENLITKISAKFSAKKKHSSTEKKTPSPCPTAKSDSFLFLSLSLFNFYCSVLLLNFLGKLVEVIGEMMLEAVSFSALMSLLMVIFVIRPSFRLSPSRFWALAAYTVYTVIAAYQIYLSSSFPESSNYLTPAAIALACLITALFSAFLRIDRISLRKSVHKKEEEVLGKEEEQVVADPVQAPVSKAPSRGNASSGLPAGSAPQSKRKERKKIELKPSKTKKPKSGDQAESDNDVQAVVTKSPTTPLQPISDEKKEALRNRLARNELLSSPSISKGNSASISLPQPNSSNPEDKPLSAEEIKAKFASRLEKTRAIAKLSKTPESKQEKADENPANPVSDNKDAEAQKSDTNEPSPINPDDAGANQKKAERPSDESDQKRSKLSLPKSN